jgi:hypothetical protein
MSDFAPQLRATANAVDGGDGSLGPRAVLAMPFEIRQTDVFLAKVAARQSAANAAQLFDQFRLHFGRKRSSPTRSQTVNVGDFA